MTITMAARALHSGYRETFSPLFKMEELHCGKTWIASLGCDSQFVNCTKKNMLKLKMGDAFSPTTVRDLW